MRRLLKLSVFIIICHLIFVAGCPNFHRTERPKPIQRGEVLRFGEGSIQNVREFTMEMTPMDIALRTQVGTILPSTAPEGYPARLSWRPLRNFGPFYSGSDLTKIQMTLNGRNAGWFYKDFFAGHEDSAIFQKYYGTNLPSTAPTINVVPGNFPTTDGFNDILMELQRVRYSSRYGGSVQLQFKSIEDYEVEVRKGTTLWELKELVMRVYLVPKDYVFNPNYPIGNVSVVYIEFEPIGLVAYEMVGTTLKVLPDNSINTLETALGDYAAQINNAIFGTEANRFTYGFVHSQFKDYISATDKVDMIEITDDFLDLHTRAGEVVFLFNMRVSNIKLDTEWGDEEIVINMAAEHVFDTGNQVPNPVISREFEEINDREGTPFKNFGIFRLEECNALHDVIFNISVLEVDSFPNQSDRFDTIFNSAYFDCSNLQNRANSGNFGTVSQNSTEGVVLMADDNVEGAFSYITQVQLLLR